MSNKLKYPKRPMTSRPALPLGGRLRPQGKEGPQLAIRDNME
jgi:hypothetical protein